MFDIRTGELRHVVSIEQRSSTQDAYGQQSTSWTEVAAGVRAKVEPYQAREQVQAQQYQAEISHRITLRHRPIFDDPQTAALYRLVYKGRRFNVNGSTNQEERNVYTVLLCTEGRSDG
jgi:SPP1 family predicted phage head-tail adaptor